MIDDKLQYHFAFNFTLPSAKVESSLYTTDMRKIVFGANGQAAPVKIQAYPTGRNKLIVRLENIGDLFDYPAGAVPTDTAVYVDIPALAKDLYFKSNGAGYYLNQVNIVETQLTSV